jgi:hypothetical protein
MINAFVLSFLGLASTPQTPPANPACSLLTTTEAASIIGAGGKSISVTTTPTGATCMVQNGDKIITILQVALSTAEAATGLWNAKKGIVSGQDLAGWPTKAYAGSLKDLNAVGLTKDKTFIEVRVTDSAPAKSDLSARLQSVMKAVAGRMP